MRPIARFVALALVLPALALAAGEPARPEAREVDLSHPWTIGAPLPAFEAPDLRGPKNAPVSIRGFKGRPLLVNLWASWCTPCVAELPQLQKLHAKMAERGLKTVAISVDENFDEAEMVVGDLDLKFLVLFDPAQLATTVWRAAQIPVSFLYDRSGRLVWRHSGVVDIQDPAFLAALEVALRRP